MKKLLHIAVAGHNKLVDIGNGSLFSPLIQKIVARQSRKIEKTLSKTKIDVQIISHSKAGEIKGLLKQEHDTNKTVILMSGANMIVDFSQYLPETVLKAGGALLHNLDQDKIHQVGTQTIMKNSGVVGYTQFMANSSQQRFFPDQRMKLILVRHATRQDAIDIVSYGGGNTVLIIAGHGDSELTLMSKGEHFTNRDIALPVEPLKAFIQHTCGGGETDYPLGMAPWTKEVYGYDRGVHPVDYLRDPFRKK